MEMMMGMLKPKEMFHNVVDMIMKRKNYHQVIGEQALRGEEETVCTTSVTALNYEYQGIKENLNKEMGRVLGMD